MRVPAFAASWRRALRRSVAFLRNPGVVLRRNGPALALRVGLTALLLAALPAPGAAKPSAASPIPPATRQLLVALADDWDQTSGSLALFERPAPGAAWKPVVRALPVRFGRTGMAWGLGLHRPEALPGPEKREGDGKAPAGVFALGPAFAYEPKELGAMKLPVLQANATLVCVDDVASGLYNTLVDAQAMHAAGRPHGIDTSSPADAQSKPSEPSHERMRRADEQYRFGLVVRHNMEPPVPGAGSCIFLHIWRSPESSTSGCTAMPPERMKALLTRLNPAKQPLLVQLPRDEYVRLRQGWGLP